MDSADHGVAPSVNTAGGELGYVHLIRTDGYDDETTMDEMLEESGRNSITAMFGKGASALGRLDEAGFESIEKNR